MPENVARVFVNAQGQIFLNGHETNLAALKNEFVQLKAAGGSVEYSRADPAGEPPPQALEVMKAIIDASLPVRLLESPS